MSDIEQLNQILIRLVEHMEDSGKCADPVLLEIIYDLRQLRLSDDY